jgi:hypothetical protein
MPPSPRVRPLLCRRSQLFWSVGCASQGWQSLSTPDTQCHRCRAAFHVAHMQGLRFWDWVFECWQCTVAGIGQTGGGTGSSRLAASGKGCGADRGAAGLRAHDLKRRGRAAGAHHQRSPTGARGPELPGVCPLPRGQPRRRLWLTFVAGASHAVAISPCGCWSLIPAQQRLCWRRAEDCASGLRGTVFCTVRISRRGIAAA